MKPRCSRLTSVAAAVLLATTSPLLAQDPDDDEHAVHHPETEAAEAAPPAAEAQPPAGMMGQGMMMGPGMMQPEGDERGPMAEGMMSPGMMHGMMQGMMESMMRGTAEGLARGLIEGIAAVHDMDPEVMRGRGMGPPAMRQPGMMHGHGIGPTLLYGPPAEGVTVERAQAMLEGALAWHGNPRLALGDVTEHEETIVAEIVTVDGSLVQRVAIDRATGAFRPVD